MSRPRVQTDDERRVRKNARSRAWRAANPERVREYGRRQYHETRKTNPLFHDYNRAYRLRSVFGLEVGEYAAILAEQGGVCAVCRERETATRNGQVKRLAVDHDHLTGRNRGLLCQRCNTFIGQARDRRELLAAADKYLAAQGD